MTSKNTVAEMMLEWEQTQKKADYLKDQITKAVLEIGTVEAGTVHATLNKPKQFRDYRLAVEETPRAMDLLRDEFFTIENLNDKIYKQICEKLELDAPVGKVTGATVTLKYD